MKGVHEDQVGTSRYLYAHYKRGNIVRRFELWGVVTKCLSVYNAPMISWWVDGWLEPSKEYEHADVSAPYAHDYEGIPDHVLVRATLLKLIED